MFVSLRQTIFIERTVVLTGQIYPALFEGTMYFAPGAAHPPRHVPKEWSDRYKGKFDQGWDKVREETFTRRKRLDP